MFSKAKSKPSADGKKAQNGALHDAPAAQQMSAPTPSRRSAPMKPSGVPSIISADVVMRGNINSSGEIQLDGSLEGDIKAGSLIIGEKAAVKGEVICETVMVRGRVEGGIRAKSVSLAAGAHIMGDILHSSLSVETGAHFEGNCRHSDDPLSEASAKDFRRTRPTNSGPRPVATTAAGETAEPRTTANDAAAPSFLSQGRSPLR